MPALRRNLLRNATTLLFSTLAALSAQATHYQGTITGTVTTADPGAPGGYSAGELITGYYSYDSPSQDGTFSGDVRVPATLTMDGHFGFVSFRDPANLDSFLTVLGGVVTDVDVNGESGAKEWWITENSFHFLKTGSPSSPAPLNVWGVLSFSAPQSGTASLPDGGPTAGLLGVGLGTSWLVRRWLRR